MFWYSRLFQNFPQFIVIHTVKGFGIVNKAEIDVFWNSFAFSMIQQMLAIWSLVPLPFLKPAWTCLSSWFTYCWSLAWRILSITLLACAAAAKSLQSCLTLCDPIDRSPAGSTVPEILQARTLEWVAIAFSVLVCEMSVIVQWFEHSLALPFLGIGMKNWPFTLSKWN